MSETLLDVKGMSCPLPVLRANRSLRSMAPTAPPSPTSRRFARKPVTR